MFRKKPKIRSIDELTSSAKARDELLFKVLPYWSLELMQKYFRLEVEGQEHLPTHGPALITPNHSGFLAIDAMVLSHEILKITGRVPRVMSHHLWFVTKFTKERANQLGFIEARKELGLSELQKRHLLVLFPEGERGNFKPSSKAYQLEEFRRGFVRMAIETQTPIIPTVIIGAEESNINLGRFNLTKYFKNIHVPLPLNWVPLPSKWKIRFLEPYTPPYEPMAANDKEIVREVAEDVQEKIQKAINYERRQRSSSFW